VLRTRDRASVAGSLLFSRWFFALTEKRCLPVCGRCFRGTRQCPFFLLIYAQRMFPPSAHAFLQIPSKEEHRLLFFSLSCERPYAFPFLSPAAPCQMELFPSSRSGVLLYLALVRFHDGRRCLRRRRRRSPSPSEEKSPSSHCQ